MPLQKYITNVKTTRLWVHVSRGHCSSFASMSARQSPCRNEETRRNFARSFRRAAATMQQNGPAWTCVWIFVADRLGFVELWALSRCCRFLNHVAERRLDALPGYAAKASLEGHVFPLVRGQISRNWRTMLGRYYVTSRVFGRIDVRDLEVMPPGPFDAVRYVDREATTRAVVRAAYARYGRRLANGDRKGRLESYGNVFGRF